ncbi:GumC family protein [Sulfitobacter sp.]|uniref:GumC family protein n=1 Tax=Sulfitobacter sp. TaxID=1903071 RepID=UPI00356AD75B
MSNRPTSLAQPAQDELDLMQLLGLAWRGKWIIAICIAVCLLVSIVYVREIAVPRYQATAKILISQRSAQVIDFESVVSGVSADAAAINTELEIIRSPAMIEKLVKDMALYEDPEFNLYLREISPWSIKGITNWWRAMVSGPAPVRPEQTESQAIESAMNMVSRSLRLQAQEKTHLFDIYVTTEEKKKSVRMANRLADLYIEQQVGTKFEAVGYAVDWLSDRVVELGAEMSDREDQIKVLRADTGMLNEQDLDALSLRLRDLEDRYASASDALEVDRKRVEQARALQESGDTEGLIQLLRDVLPRRILDNLQGLSDGNTTAQQQIDAQIRLLEAGAQRQQEQRGSLYTALIRLRDEVDVETQKFTQLSAVIREAESTRTLLDTFSARLKETSLQAGLQQADSQLISPARNGLQVEPRAKRTYSLAVVFGVLMGLFLIVVRQFTQNGFRSSAEVTNSTGLPVIGQLPIIPIKRRDQLIPYLMEKPTSAAAEAIRNLRTSLTMLDLETSPQVIMLTSSIPGEGKTTTSIALAMNFAKLGRKVLFIEGDIRRRTLTNYFKQIPGYGLVDAMSGERPWEEAVIHDDDLDIDILMGQTSKTNAADLFASANFTRLMSAARERYDHIIIDTPPVLLVPDARLIARHCDTLAYVVHWDSTDRAQVADGLSQLQSLGINVTGIVLSQVDPAGMKRYGYGNRYGAYTSYDTGYYSN